MSTAQLTDLQVCELGAKLKTAREAQGRDLADAAARIALSPSQLRALESGDRRPFYSNHYFLQAAERYANFLGITIAEIAAYRATFQASVIAAEHSMSDTQAADGSAAPMPDADLATPTRHDAVAESAAAIAEIRDQPISKRPPLLAALAIGAAVIAVATLLVLKENPAPAPAVARSEAPAATPAAPVAAEAPPIATAQAGTTGPAPTPAAAAPMTAMATPAAATVSPAPSPATVTSAATSLPAATLKQSVVALTGDKDSRIQSTTGAWVQIVSKTGEKSNLRIAAGESIDFVSAETAAVVIGQPDKATLTVRGKAVDLKQYASGNDGAARALVIIGNLRP